MHVGSVVKLVVIFSVARFQSQLPFTQQPFAVVDAPIRF